MILEFNDIKIDFFETFPREVKNIGLNLSGGADSALILFLLVEMIKERNQSDVRIFPFHGIESEFSADICVKIIQHINEITNTKFIEPLYLYDYPKPLTVSKLEAFNLALKDFMAINNTFYTIRGLSQGMDDLERPKLPGDQVGKNLMDLSLKYPHTLPWATVNKKFIAEQYKKFNLQHLSTITNSCIASATSPCRKCWWCKERYWAFGSYDGGIQ